MKISYKILNNFLVLFKFKKLVEKSFYNPPRKRIHQKRYVDPFSYDFEEFKVTNNSVMTIKPKGKLIFAEPNMLNPQLLVQKNIPFIKKMLGDTPDETAFVRFSLKKKLKKYGFKNIQIKPFDFLHPFIPESLIKPVLAVQNIVEKIPVIKEISGSLIIYAEK